MKRLSQPPPDNEQPTFKTEPIITKYMGKRRSINKFATSTLRGQKVIQPIVTSIPFEQTTRNSIKESTMQEFDISNKYVNLQAPHKINHVEQNILSAKYFRD